MAFDPRDLEWQRRYEAADTPWDKGEAAPPLVEFLRKNEIAGRILVPGCGKGHDVRALAGQPNSSVMGLDLAPSAIMQARDLPNVAQFPNIEFVNGDFFLLPPGLTIAFDWLVEHTCFCAIEPRQRPDYVRSAAASLRTGGKLFGIFYLTPDVDDGPPFAVTEKELTELFRPHFTLLEKWVPTTSFPGRENRELVCIMQKT